mmetsp:Transcript_94954/g.252132  ORF Transcript_94954/g.252132 Transcript_94954/m.252132 type:complete len:234 (-) Transcript_94954:616-1317(-)
MLLHGVVVILILHDAALLLAGLVGPVRRVLVGLSLLGNQPLQSLVGGGTACAHLGLSDFGSRGRSCDRRLPLRWSRGLHVGLRRRGGGLTCPWAAVTITAPAPASPSALLILPLLLRCHRLGLVGGLLLRLRSWRLVIEDLLVDVLGRQGVPSLSLVLLGVGSLGHGELARGILQPALREAPPLVPRLQDLSQEGAGAPVAVVHALEDQPEEGPRQLTDETHGVGPSLRTESV